MKKLICICGGTIEEGIVDYEGFSISGFTCNKCGEITFSPEQFKIVLQLKEVATKLNSKRKVVRIGNSLGITLPKAIKEIGVKEGSYIELKLGNKKRIELLIK